MANRKRHSQKKCSPEEEQSGRGRPTQFREHPGYARDVKGLDTGTRAKIRAQVEQFKKDWRDPLKTKDELKMTWSYKNLKGPARRLDVEQITLTGNRVALVVVRNQDPCVWLLHTYKRSGKNQNDYDLATRRAREVKEGLV